MVSPLLRESQLLDLLSGEERERLGDNLFVSQIRNVNETELRQPIINYCREMLRGAGPAQAGIRPGRPSDEGARLIRQMAGILNGCTDQADRERVAGELCTYLNNANLRGYHFNLNVVPGSNNPSRPATIEGTFRQTVGERSETVRIVPIPIDNRFWNEAAVRDLNGLIGEYFRAGQAGGEAAAIRARFRALWRTVPAGQRENVRTQLNTRLQTHNPPLYVVHPPRNSTRLADGLDLESLDVRQGILPDPAAQQANAGDNRVGNQPIRVGEVNDRQAQQITARALIGGSTAVAEAAEPTWWDNYGPLVLGIGGPSAVLAALYGLSRLPGYLRNRRESNARIARDEAQARQADAEADRARAQAEEIRGRQPAERQVREPETAARQDTGQETAQRQPTEQAEASRIDPEVALRQRVERATDISARQLFEIAGDTTQTRTESILTAFDTASSRNNGNRFFNPQALNLYQSRCMTLIGELNSFPIESAELSNRLTDFVREFAAHEMINLPENIRNRIHVIVNPALEHTNGGVVARQTLVYGLGANGQPQLQAVNIELPPSRLSTSGPVLHETLASLYGQLYRMEPNLQLSPEQRTNLQHTNQVLTDAAAVENWLQFRMNENNQLVVPENVNNDRARLGMERPLGACPEGHMWIDESGRLRMRSEQGRELTDQEIHQRLLQRMEAEVRSLEERARTAPEGQPRQALEEQARTARERYNRFANPHHPQHTTTRTSLLGSFRNGMARYGGRLIPYLVVAQEVIRHFLSGH
ncbi:MAG: hypothetical protein C5B53_06530 [Candidatus Melainabacteria bacterium]|nr:MAG: hypothetical protein C5B53_06530 [Candidatus Melainabacteria bacterium]